MSTQPNESQAGGKESAEIPLLEKPHKELSIAHFAPGGFRGWLVRGVAPFVDWLIGLRKLRSFYDTHLAEIYEKDEFAAKILEALQVDVQGTAGFERLPETGPLIVVSNHPYGALEGVILGLHIGRRRPDLKIMANRGLSVVQELGGYFIYTQPLLPNDPRNRASIRECVRHLKNGGVLGLFPAGRVAYYQPEKKRIADGQWNRLPVNLGNRSDAAYLPVHISGTTSRLFQTLGRIYFRFRLLLLVREMFQLERKQVVVSVGAPISQDTMNGFDAEQSSDFLRLQVFLKDQDYDVPWPKTDAVQEELPLINPVDRAELRSEVDQLPESQRLAEMKGFAVYYAYQEQAPAVVREITRLREATFRTMNEGSGQPCDTDGYDATYTHLFIVDETADRLIGAYRMGQTDRLLQADGLDGIYLTQMFDFGESFFNRKYPCLEMGRSFIVPEYQKTYTGLLLLWKGIGAFLAKNPRYRYLYGTVSLSKLYSVSSAALMNEVLVESGADVRPKIPFPYPLHPEAHEYIDKYAVDLKGLSKIVATSEPSGMEVPILMKQYAKLGAKFHALGIDPNFAATPGMLLSVHVPSSPTKSLRAYFGEALSGYLEFDGPSNG